MTGEMYSINQDGEDSSGNIWPIHAAIAKALGGTLQPFDQYQGPYILIGQDVRVGNAPNQSAVQNMGVIRLWLVVGGDDLGQVYREDTDRLSESFLQSDIRTAIICAGRLMSQKEIK